MLRWNRTVTSYIPRCNNITYIHVFPFNKSTSFVTFHSYERASSLTTTLNCPTLYRFEAVVVHNTYGDQFSHRPVQSMNTVWYVAQSHKPPMYTRSTKYSLMVGPCALRRHMLFCCTSHKASDAVTCETSFISSGYTAERNYGVHHLTTAPRRCVQLWNQYLGPVFRFTYARQIYCAPLHAVVLLRTIIFQQTCHTSCHMVNISSHTVAKF